MRGSEGTISYHVAPRVPAHRVLDGFLARVAAHPDGDAFALRGGMLVRHWFPDLGRVASDVDLVCGWPLELARVRSEVARILAVDARDGVRFAERFRLDPIQTHTPHPGLRLVAPARVDGEWDELYADLTFRLPLWPEATMARLGAAHVAVCGPETLVARKLAVTAERGPGGWRPKDLADLYAILEHRGPSLGRLGEAVERMGGLAELADGPSREIFWQDPIAMGRWARFRRRQRQLAVPYDLHLVVEAVRTAIRRLVPREPA